MSRHIRRAVHFADKLFGADAVMSDIVVVTNGGYPLDQNIYQTVKE